MAGPLTPPVGTRFSTGEDLGLLQGPTSAPAGAVIVTPGGPTLADATTANPAGTTFYLTAGTHVLGGATPTAFDQVVPKSGNTYIGAPGAVLSGRNTNRYAFTQQASNVTIRYLEVTAFACLLDEFVVNHDTGPGWKVEYCNIHHNTGAGVGIGHQTIVRHCWLHHNSQYGFSSYRPPVQDGAVNALGNVTVDHCEISHNGTLSDEVNPDGSFTGNGRNGAGKFWDTNGIQITNNWAHHSNLVTFWADTNNVDMRVENNLIEYGWGEGFMYEISYGFLVKNNTFRYNAIAKGKHFAGRGDNFPVASIYISEAGSDPVVGVLYNNGSEIVGNTFHNNWGDITLWENADRFCNSPGNTSGKVYKPFGHGASLAMCNQPTAKVLRIATTAGSPNFNVDPASGSLETTDEGRPATGAGIPTGTVISPGFPHPLGVLNAHQGVLSANATATASGVTLILAAGSINTEPAYSACRWKTQNITVHGNTFNHDPAVVVGSTVLPAGVRSGKIAVISQFGSYPHWSPYKGTVIQDAITFAQNNRWLSNAYTGGYSFMPHDTGRNESFAQWQAAPYNQDAGSTFSSTPTDGGGTPPPPPPPSTGNSLWANIGAGKVSVVDLYGVTGSGRAKAVTRSGG